MILCYIPCKDKKEAEKIAKFLLDKKLIACANIFPIISISKWTKKIRAIKEHILIVKTNKNFNAIKKEIEKIHSYKIPCILEIKVKANDKYDKWVRSEVK
ncbi:MAG: divalent-cation tolerance protein CutA [Candidatus Nanoarchaeia archaeon]